MKGLQNKVAVITGATSGIGLAAALSLAEEGVNLVFAGRAQREVRKFGIALRKKA